MSKRKAIEDLAAAADGSSCVEITPLGAGQEVGRSCIILKYEGKTVMLDCGIHPAYSGINSLPYFDGCDVTTVDVALITHFHLDHCAAVPWLLRKTKFKGRIFMTHPTKAIYNSLLRDFAKSSKGSADEQLYDESDVEASLDRIEVIDFMQTLDVNGIKITPYRAGHVLGAAMFMVEVAGMRCLYTGDYSRIPDRHLPCADIPPVRPDIVIIESTYGVSRHLPTEERERQFLSRITSTVKRGGRVLLPVVALGRSQELLLMMDEYWEQHPELQGVPMYQASGMMRKALTVYQTYVEMMNEDIRRVFHERNPFNFRHVTHLKNSQNFDDIGSCVLMATPSGLQSGVSRDVFEAWCEDERNAVIICDFAVQGTLAREILGGPTHVLTKTGMKKPLKCSVDHISFSAHADFDQTSGFLDTVQPPHVVLVHGEATEMGRLKGALERGAAALSITRNVFTPKVNQTVQIAHKPLRLVRVVGRLAEKPPHEGQQVQGVLVAPLSTKGQASTAQTTLMHPDDLPAFTKMYRGRVTQRQAISVGEKPFSDLRLALEVMFEGVEGAGTVPVSGVRASEDQTEGGPSVRVGDHVTVSYRTASLGTDAHVVVEWEGGKVGDMVADAVVAVLLQAVGEPAGVVMAEEARQAALLRNDSAAATTAELQLIAALLQAQFGPAVVDEAAGTVEVTVDNQTAIVDYHPGKVICSEEGLRVRLEKAVSRLLEALRPCPLGE
eukprot:CAMPEP_0202904758 /NCGR_PEP_ID=MMETSP1392-20130828/30978_1 /ASSEMBLY_ACC=CAM_ASM_000868 /TAXON_ID=225041 /ORGANISM="Chlamydomonas chlamydogama, Strain SAG 11-48b" /LENGTH=723 /DNA_ID=CAMNT_0049592553 /DNA_START=19 /DNA_END=2190 /DNA_ORIENTATION=+